MQGCKDVGMRDARIHGKRMQRCMDMGMKDAGMQGCEDSGCRMRGCGDAGMQGAGMQVQEDDLGPPAPFLKKKK